MRVLDGEQGLVRIFLRESDKWHHTPLSRALLERLRRDRRDDYRGSACDCGASPRAAICSRRDAPLQCS